MFRHRGSLAVLALALAGTLAATAALAGGHVDIAATSMPAKIVAGQPLELAFTLTYPNGEPLRDAKPVVFARCGATRIEVPAAAARKAGTYVARVTLPREGSWAFEIDARYCGNKRRLAPVMALAAAPASAKTAAR